MEVTMAVVADGANVTGDGRLNLLGVFDVIHARTIPCRHVRLYVVIRIKADIGEKGEEHDLTVRLLDADGRALDQPPPMPLVFPEELPFAMPEQTIIIEMMNLTFPQPGSYEFEIAIDGERRRAIDLHVHPARIVQEDR